MLINWTVQAVMNESSKETAAATGASVFKDHPVVLISTRDLQRECADLLHGKSVD